MLTGIIVLISIAILGGSVAWLLHVNMAKWGPESSSGTLIAVRDIPLITERLRSTAKEPSWVAFTFETRPKSKDYACLQFSFEGGIVGLDWVLLQPRNVKDREKFTSLATLRNQTVVEKKMNGVEYLRVESGDTVGLGMQILEQIYGLRGDSKLEIIADGFDWRS